MTQLVDKDEVQALRDAVPDLKESLEIGRDNEEGMPNMWPTSDEEAKEFKEIMLAFFDECKDLHRSVMRALALGLGIEESWFDGFTDRGDNTLRLLHYPSVSKEVFRKNGLQVRAGSHTDYGMSSTTKKLRYRLTSHRLNNSSLPRLTRRSPSSISIWHLCRRNTDPRHNRGECWRPTCKMVE